MNTLINRQRRKVLLLVFGDRLAIHTTAHTTASTTSTCCSCGSCLCNYRRGFRRNYFTNGDIVKQQDPYSILGLSYGDGATTKEIRDAFKRMASKTHPDVNITDSPTVALQKFQLLQRAYDALIKNSHRRTSGDDSINEDNDEWRYRIWNQGDRIACDRTDVAGRKRRRPIMPALKNDTFNGMSIGHPLNGLRYRGSGEYLTDGTDSKNNTNVSGGTVGRGFNKWVDRDNKSYVPWSGSPTNSKR
jgi:curved DNA-binding protein CbpA